MSLQNDGLDDVNYLPRLRSLCEWLTRRAGRHIRRLHLELGGPDAIHTHEEPEALVLLAASLTACNSMTELHLTGLSIRRLPLGPWLALASLRHIRIHSGGHMSISGSLRSLSALESLELEPEEREFGIRFTPEARLPVSLTRLCLGYKQDFDFMPDQVRMGGCQFTDLLEHVRHFGRCLCKHWPCCKLIRGVFLHCLQIGELVRLRHLTLCSPGHIAEGYAPLARLTCLQHLELVPVRWSVPDCLSRLTQLKSLSVCHDTYVDEEDIEELPRQLRHLTQLTRLALDITADTALTLTALNQLHSLCCCRADDDVSLHAGPWLANLQRLVAPSELVVGSLEALGAAQQLERLGVTYADTQQLVTIVRWAAQQPQLKRLHLCSTGHSYSSIPSYDDVAHVLEAQRRRPDLIIDPNTEFCSDAWNWLQTLD